MQMQENWEVKLVVNAIVVALLTLLLLLYLISRNFLFAESASESAGDSAGGPESRRRRRRRRSPMPAPLPLPQDCFVCGLSASKKCSRCKAVPYCSPSCQQKHWSSGHKHHCKQPPPPPPRSLFSKQPPKPILFPYRHFLHLFTWDNPTPFPPCGLLNCGNSCFANVVLQCLASTRPLVAFLLQNGHRAQCIRTDWCFLCELETHIRRATQSSLPFSPTNIISRLPYIGGNLGYGRQEDAHEFMRFAIDTMQSVCLDEFGGEKAVPPSSQETTVIQHIFGGRLQSQVICTECNNISNQYENMMDLTVEIHGEAASLEECLDQYTKREWLDGDNMYKCDGCNDYVKAWKRLSVKCPPNILTIALKRFQSGRFGKLNKRVSFPERLELKRYTKNEADEYNLYAVVVHVDTLNASYFGHYICYVKDLSGCSWYRLDDCKVGRVELDEVLSQSAYMLLYSRVKARASCLELPVEKIEKKEEEELIIPFQPDCFTNGNGNGNSHCVEDGPVSVSSNRSSKREEEKNHQSKTEDDDDDPQHPIHESNGEMELHVEHSKDDDDDEMYLSSTSNGDAVESHQHAHEHEEACNSSNGGEEGEIMIHNNSSFKCCGANNTVQNGFHVHHHHHHQSVDMVTTTTTTTDDNLL